MKNFTDQMADIAKTITSKDIVIKMQSGEIERLKKAIRKLQLENCELKSNKNNES